MTTSFGEPKPSVIWLEPPAQTPTSSSRAVVYRLALRSSGTASKASISWRAHKEAGTRKHFISSTGVLPPGPNSPSLFQPSSPKPDYASSWQTQYHHAHTTIHGQDT
ncbi:hypothetical protein N657DRAFT_221109 [Parathielavia appendiculata]|uniref:Uncharacterized protein n=1 Tax=Parathielavia appendiculata TaxID=2587402 RepID=A0AAN6U760_9PEZI|nr:hypothetical protein N657DRAFT_221109 [Parathielavia appendiculata]